MKVRAKKRGFFGGIYYPAGDSRVFEVTEDQYSSNWMEKVDGRKKKKPEDKPKDGYVPLEIPSLMEKYADDE